MSRSDDYADIAKRGVDHYDFGTAQAYATLALVEAVNDLRVMLERRLSAIK